MVNAQHKIKKTHAIPVYGHIDIIIMDIIIKEPQLKKMIVSL